MPEGAQGPWSPDRAMFHEWLSAVPWASPPSSSWVQLDDRDGHSGGTPARRQFIADTDESDTTARLLGVSFTYAVADNYRVATAGSPMSAWVIASVVGGLFALVIIALLVVVSRAVMRTARNAGELMVALDEVQARTKVLADLEAQSSATARVADQATSALQELRQRQSVGERVGEREGNSRESGH